MPSVAVERVRIPFVQRARLSRRGVAGEVFLVDLGLQGVFVETTDDLALGEGVEIEFRLPGNALPLRARARVAWLNPGGEPRTGLPRGAGLQFVEFSGSDAARLRDFLVDYCRREGAARRFTRPWPGAEGLGGET
jgi:Tfp pilus assembly protein PilZ